MDKEKAPEGVLFLDAGFQIPDARTSYIKSEAYHPCAVGIGRGTIHRIKLQFN